MANSKRTTAFFCQECGYESAKWTGQCPSCHAWNTMVEEPVRAVPASGGSLRGTVGRGLSDAARPVPLSQVKLTEENRVLTGFTELDRVLGGGIVPGSLVLVGGDPGIGKSTLLLQMTRNLAAAGHHILYVSGEESLRQIKLRAVRIGEIADTLTFLCETDLDTISDVILQAKPELVVIDSIQTMYSPAVQASPGSISQVREATGMLLRLAKENGITIFIVGHVTKEGTVAGPRVLEHMVDTVLYFEGDRNASYRVLRSSKNRFGSTNEIGLFEMRGDGLAEVTNASAYLLSDRPQGASGSVVTCSVEGTRPLLLEIQALVTESRFGFPKRQTVGIDYNRVSLLMAVLEKRLGIPLGGQDAYVNLAGGVKLNEPALDLAIAMAILSSYRNRPIGDDVAVFGEIGLSGEIRSCQQGAARVQEAVKLGFKTIVLPKWNLRGITVPDGVKVVGVRGLQEAADLVL